MCTVPLLRRVCRESYSDPRAVYEGLKRRGMDLVTVTDHDSIDAAEELRRHPDFFLSEEVTCITPDGNEIHVGVYGIDERDHIQLERRRRDVPALAAYLHEEQIFFSINHVLSSLTGRRTADDFRLFEDEFPAIETLNGMIPRPNNNSADQLARDCRKAAVGGSDAHTLASLGLTYTEVPGAANMRDYLRGLRRGQARVHGSSGDYGKLTRAVLQIGCGLVKERAWALALAPLLLIVPLVTLGNYAREILFHQKWSRRLWPGVALEGRPAIQTSTSRQPPVLIPPVLIPLTLIPLTLNQLVSTRPVYSRLCPRSYPRNPS
jgi:predicted metal-dependent phosphoesterase TrpH